MNIRNVKRISDKEYNLEIEHPDFGWIPYTAVTGSGEKEMESIFKKAKKVCKCDDVDLLQRRFAFLTNHDIKTKTAALKKNYSQDEIQTWETKRKEAEKVLSGETSELIEFEAKLSNEKPKDLATKIISKSNAYHKELITAATLKKKVEKDKVKIKSVEDYEKLNNEYLNILKVEDGKTD